MLFSAVGIGAEPACKPIRSSVCCFVLLGAFVRGFIFSGGSVRVLLGGGGLWVRLLLEGGGGWFCEGGSRLQG